MEPDRPRGEKIILIEDDLAVRLTLSAYLEKAGYSVISAPDIHTGLQQLKAAQPDLILLDLQLPDGEGLELAREVRANQHLFDIPIIILSARAETGERILGLELGADDYIAKPFDPREVLARVHAQLRGRKFYTSKKSVLQAGSLELDNDTRQLRFDSRKTDLTPIEFRIIHALMQRPGSIFTREQLQTKAASSYYGMTDRTLDTHMRNLRKKIKNVSNDCCCIQTSYGVGYRLTAD